MNALHHRGRSRRLALDCELLEDRLVPAGFPDPIEGPGTANSGINYDLNRTITIHGTSDKDVITIDQQNPFLRVYRKTNDRDGGVTEETRWFILLPGTKFVIRAGEGDDEVRNNTSLPSVIYGDNGYDLLVGGSAGDEIHTGNNGGIVLFPGAMFRLNDFAYGRDGKDTLIGGDGVDQLFGEDGDDLMYGHGGNEDLLMGGNHNDVLYGGAGKDQLYGEDGTDTLYGEAGDDQLLGGNGVDYFYGGTENDSIFSAGDNAVDEIETGTGMDAINPDWHAVAGTGLKVIDDHINDMSVDDTIVW
jgi:Ca2+-binding RTX toxin-like protein